MSLLMFKQMVATLVVEQMVMVTIKHKKNFTKQCHFMVIYIYLIIKIPELISDKF